MWKTINRVLSEKNQDTKLWLNFIRNVELEGPTTASQKENWAEQKTKGTIFKITCVLYVFIFITENGEKPPIETMHFKCSTNCQQF